jgi:hypothetical protein
MMLLLLFPVFSFPQNTNSTNQKEDSKTFLWKKNRTASVKSDTLANHLIEPFDPAKEPKTEMWLKQRSEAVVKHPDSLNRNSPNSNPEADNKSILWEKNSQYKINSPRIDAKSSKLNPKVKKE